MRRWAEDFFTLGKFAPDLGPGASDDAALLLEVEAAIANEAVGGAVNREIEIRFRRDTAEVRSNLFVRVALLGVILYDLFLPVDALVVPDVLRLAVILQLLVMTPLAVIIIGVIRRFRIVSEIPSAATLGLMLAAALVTFLMSASPHAGLFACVFSLFFIIGNVGLGQSFRWAMVTTFVGNAMTVAAILAHPMLDLPSQVFAVTVNTCASIYSLIGTHRLESGVRQGYLYALREALRASRLATANIELRDLVDMDGLTGVANRRYFERALANLWRQPWTDRPVALLMIDIDHFKTLNDRYGHQVGDECLRVVAKTLAGMTEADNLTLARYGGEEFALLIEGADLAEGLSLGQRLRVAVSQLDLHVDSEPQPVRVTVSIGCGSVVPGPAASAFDLVAMSDAALYKAKQGGRNRTCADLLQAA